MKKVLHINLGSYPFTIDIDAYELMDSYFLSLEKHFSKHENPDEIIYDIESRMAELFHENVGQATILTVKDIEEAIKIMGRPGDFEDDDIVVEEMKTGSNKRKSNDEQFRFQTGKKLYRDIDNKVISGVCSGLSTYFGIQDPIWLRITTFILFFMSGGTAAIVYLILSVVLPKAKTTADKKAMRGEPIDINVVADSVEEEIETLSEQIQDWAGSFREKRRQKRFRRKRKY